MSATETTDAPDVPLVRRWIETAVGEENIRSIDRGRAGAGRLVEALVFEPGRVHARVPAGRGRSFESSVAVPELDEDSWQELVDRCATQVRHLAALLQGNLPVVAQDDLLLPPGPLQAQCSCVDRQPCRHVASLLHGIGVAIERDPSRLLRIRGRSVEEVVAALRSTRMPDEPKDDSDDLAEPFTARGDLDAVEVHPVPEPEVRSVLDKLGPPPGFAEDDEIADLMVEAAALAWKLAAGEGAEVADDEALLAELRAQGVATAASIADSLGMEANDAMEALDRLHGDGDVLRMGEGEAARYRAA